ncbi:MAG: bifunctional hydroxymethylpyrimidine kinase/phosphomethylpyrimidine kinase [Alicyclobacillaceae bacterium]|nr:bifunctional hydroxymethylpyrimidine kinase/phosphomethylpyrimidine kinase [Alicyclobacillaceae bacterium]
MFRSAGGHVARALTIAGSDSGGGAGIQADLKTFAAFDVYGLSVLTALTAQNTLGVQGVLAAPPEFVALQMQSVFDDVGADAVKTGMLGERAVVEAVAQSLSARGVRSLVVDPVMVAKGGERLLAEAAVAALQDHLLPLAAVVTPNIPEAEALCGRSIRSWDDAFQAAQDIWHAGPAVVVIKGGHAQAGWSLPPAPGLRASGGGGALDTTMLSADLVYDGTSFTVLAAPRLPTANTHGTGCTYSAAIAAGLARGLPVLQAVAVAKAFVHEAIASARDWDVGSGHGPTDHSVHPAFTSAVPGPGWYVWQDGQWCNLSDVNLHERE